MPEKGELTFRDPLEVPADRVILPPGGFKRGFGALINAYNTQRARRWYGGDGHRRRRHRAERRVDVYAPSVRRPAG